MRNCNVDTAPVIVPKQGEISLETLSESFVPHVNALREAGLSVESAEVQFSLKQLEGEPGILRELAEGEIQDITIAELTKLGYFVRSRMTKARESLEALTPILEKHKMRLILPVKGGSLIPSPSAAFILVRGLPPYCFGVRLDPGGELFEGFEAWDYTVALLGDYLASVVVSDYVLTKHPGAEDANSKGWARRWATVQDGFTDWKEMFRQLRNIEFQGRILLKPMVSTTVAEVKSELDYLYSLSGGAADSED